MRRSWLYNNKGPGSSGARDLSGVNQRDPRIAASPFLTNHKLWIFPYRTPAFNRAPAFNDPSRCQPVIRQIELLILVLVKLHRTRRNFDPQTLPIA